MARRFFQTSDIDESKGNPWRHISPSQFNTARTCLTKWFLSRRTPRSSSPATDLGTAVHKVNEPYMRGEDVDLNTVVKDPELLEKAVPIAKCMRPHLSDNLAPENVEPPIRFQPANWPVPAIGFIDAVEPPGTTFPDGHVIPPGAGRITDEKTASAWRNAKKAEQLAKDPQGILYGGWSISEDGPFSDQDSVEFRHVTAITKGPKVGTEDGVRVTSYTFSREEIQEQLAQMLPEVVLLKELSVLNWAEDSHRIPHDSTACFKYGRCEFWDICKAAGKTPKSKKTQEEEMYDNFAELFKE